MKKVKFIYNPVSGQGVLKSRIDSIIERFQRHGFEIVPYKLLGKNDVKKAFTNFNPEGYYAIVAAGGDGTVHDVVNQMKKHNIDLPLGVVPSGTSNDFANYLDLPKDIDRCIDVITVKGETKSVDIGKINDKYFINVVSGGILSSIAHKAKKNLKNTLGMLAYYLKALEEIPNIKPFKVEVESDNGVMTENVLIFLVLNTSIAGGFKVAPNALIDDGKFDVFLIKNCNIAEFGALFLKLLRGEHIDDEKIIYFQSRNVKINCVQDDCNLKIETDIDGEKGHEFPLDIEVLSSSIRVFK